MGQSFALQGNQSVIPNAVATDTGVSPLTIPGGSLAAPSVVGRFNLSAGDFTLTTTVDLQPTLAIPQQYTCQMKVVGRNDLIDSTPVLAGNAVRLVLTGLVHLDFSSQLELSCGADAPSRLGSAKVLALHVDVVNPAVAITPGQ